MESCGEEMATSKDEATKKENKKRDTKALCLIQHAMDERIPDRIAESKSAHEA